MDTKKLDKANQLNGLINHCEREIRDLVEMIKEYELNKKCDYYASVFEKKYHDDLIKICIYGNKNDTCLVDIYDFSMFLDEQLDKKQDKLKELTEEFNEL